MPITPDTKDWTWVLDERCPECGFDCREFPREQVGALIRGNAAQWRDLLDHPKARQRPSDDRWSALEYACHVRDVFRLYEKRLGWMLEQDDPAFDNWDQDAAALEAGYQDQDPVTVADEIEQAGAELAGRFDQISGDRWERTGRRSDGANFTIESFARYFIHDPIHHVHDVEQGYERLG